MVRVTGLDMNHFAQRLLQDAISSGLASTSLHRAETFEAARSRPGDFLGQATAEEIRETDARLTAIANAFRARAALALMPDDAIEDAILDVLDEVA